jgi:hypothetical protein
VLSTGTFGKILTVAASDASSAPARERIEALISASYDTPVRVRAVDRLEPWCVLRCHLIAQASDVPASVVVKSGGGMLTVDGWSMD